ncbi:MAG: 16S rRNA (guanine(527)-N(7))-methyltransferase RsmG [Candidatus Eremiobacteraeota bacterium]|nr:16S rRNA (guanine(527)-N(7))-methyltransferase RsmG [Candidatus Eremiobacteraeota bacterium]
MTEDVVRAFADLPVCAAKRELLARYAHLLLQRNAAVNLTAARDAEGVALHVRDSLRIARFVREPLVDVGSGGGFPGIPLAIVTGASGTLIEAVGKKAAFLREVVADMQLPLAVVQARAEDAGRRPDLRESFGSATARAVGTVSTVLELTIPLLAVGGVAVLQRGEVSAGERAAASDAALMLQAELMDEAVDTEMPGRRVLVFRKVGPTGGRFPRRAGVPAKRPLCAEPAL